MSTSHLNLEERWLLKTNISPGKMSMDIGYYHLIAGFYKLTNMRTFFVISYNTFWDSEISF